ncbi:hypothetical protein BRC86_11410 [Halobacteriales archaeon QS_3_64_16]|nr:MAG: hypothetical protein BRC86_11410 [Halobacteriales archaeon QS_3_64_16]
MDTPLLLDVGGGRNPEPEHLNVDLRSIPEVDIIAAADELPISDETIDRVHVNSLVPHLNDYNRAFEEWSRVLKPGGDLIVAATHAHSTGIVQDADHRSWSWTSETPAYFDHEHPFAYYNKTELDLIECDVVAWARPDRKWLYPWSWAFSQTVKRITPEVADELMKLPFSGGRVRARYRKRVLEDDLA